MKTCSKEGWGGSSNGGREYAIAIRPLVNWARAGLLSLTGDMVACERASTYGVVR